MDDLQTLGTLLAQPEPDRDVVDRGRHQLQQRMRGPVRKRRSNRPATGLGLGLGLTVAAAATAIVVGTDGTAPTSTPNSPHVAAPMSGRQVLLVAATSAESKPAGTGAYWHVKLVFTGGGDAPQETWTRRDGQTWFRGAKSAGKVTKLAFPSPFRLGGSPMSVERLQKLPTTPDALRAWITDSVRRGDVRTSAGRPDATVQRRLVFDGLISLVSQLPAPPKVRAAAFRAIASYPDVKDLGRVEGGHGLSISYRGVTPALLVVDPATSRVRDTSVLVTSDGALMGVSSGGGATVVTEWTNRLPE